MPRSATGIRERHSKRCGSLTGARCDCTPKWQAEAYDARTGKTKVKTLATKTAAKRWRADAQSALRSGDMTTERGPKLSDAVAEWVEGMRAGTVTNRSGDRFKPSAIRGYEQALRLRVLPMLGDHRVREIEPQHVQKMIDGLVADGLAPATVESALTPLRAFYRRATARGEVRSNPTLRIEKPGVRPQPKLIATPVQAAALIDALEPEDRPLWALAFYAGLRRGEIIALRWEDVDLANGVIHVRRGWDDMEGEIEPKSAKGKRRVPIPGVLRGHLAQHRLATTGDGRLFRSMRWVQGGNDRARARWTAVNAAAREKDAEAELLPIIVGHGARHTFASLMIAAGVNAKTLSTYLGHANIGVTLDLYSHLMPGNEEEAAELFDAYLARSVDGATEEPIRAPTPARRATGQSSSAA